MARPLCGGPLAFTLVRPLCGQAPIPVADFAGELHRLTAPLPPWAGLPPGPHVMGVVNVTPDSFSDGGDRLAREQAIEAAQGMLDQGAAIVDIGGESTRPHAEPVPLAEEQRRILPVVEALARAGARVCVDTRNAATMARALDAGAAIINDVSGLHHDPQAAPLLAAKTCPVILMHMRGDPRTMNRLTRYDDAPSDVLAELGATVDAAVAAGISRDRIAVDPGFGFAKTAPQSLQLLQRLPLFVNLRCPIIAGMSRKSFLGNVAGIAEASARDPASVAAAVFALSLGATLIRAHDVGSTVQAVRVWRAMQG